MDLVTIVIVARNAAGTIERAIRSALRQSSTIVLVDDHSTDGTASIARRVAGRRLEVVAPEQHETIGLARQTGMHAVNTRFAMWIDADDEAMPGRCDRLLARLERDGADLVYDAADLHDGATGEFIRHMPIPDYLRRDPSGVRQFERNVLPSLGWPLVRTSWGQRIGYDRACHGVEDYDFFLRSSMEGARIAYEPAAGYRQFAYPTSVSRNLAARREGVTQLLRKHEYALIRSRFGAAGHSRAVTIWALVAVAFYRREWARCAEFLDEAAATIVHPDRVLEADGPCPHPEGWRLSFYRGTLALITGRDDVALQELTRAQSFAWSPESANNLGIVLARRGERAEADHLFTEAERRFPGYLDATQNLSAEHPSAITTHPLRSAPARAEYPKAS